MNVGAWANTCDAPMRVVLLSAIYFVVAVGVAHCQETGQPDTAKPVVQQPASTPAGSGLPKRTLREWADQLSHDRYLRRQAASRHLIRGGRESIPILVDQLQSNDLEVVKRVVAILTQIAEAEDPSAGDQPGSAFDSLRHIADKGVGVKSYLANSVVEGFLEQRDLEARRRLKSAGIYIGREDQALGSSKKERSVVRIDDGWDGSMTVLPWLRWVREANFAVVIGTAVQSEVLKWVVQIPELEALVINEGELTAESIRHLRPPHRINALELRYIRMDEAKLKAIEQASVRNTLYLVGTGVSNERVEEMREKLPGLDIMLRCGGFLGVVCVRPDAPYCQVDDVIPGSGAAMAGLQVNDVVIGIDGVRISRFEDLQKQVDTHIPGDKIKLRFRRQNEILEGTATLGKLQDP